ncbi:MAG: DUF3365 domain-containing protein [Verrucomicrobia bacterium]|nr:DUF3365 domain-containing protein [Verrucomicrobiota bacterium]
MNAKNLRSIASVALVGVAAWIGYSQKPVGPSKPKLDVAIKPQHVADALRAVITSQREVYTRLYSRLPATPERTRSTDSSTRASKPISSPCEVLRLCSEAVASKGVEFSFVLRSRRPIDKRNLPETDVEKKGLELAVERPDSSHSAEELLGGRWYYTAVYPDIGTDQTCVDCHNQLQPNSKTKLKLGDVFGSLVIRIALEL